MRIAHLSDLHLRCNLSEPALQDRLRWSRLPALLEEAIRRIRGEQPDLLVVSGDLVDYPLDALDDPEMRMLGERDLRLVAGYLEGVGCARAVVYGNHDHAELARRVFGHLPEDVVCADHRVICFYDHEDDHHVPHRLGREREKLTRALSDTNSLPQIHVQHYLVWPVRNEGYPHTYAEAECLLDAIVGSGIVRLVLSGHLHAGVPPFREGDTTFATVPAFCEAPHPYWVYELKGEGIVWHQRDLADVLADEDDGYRNP